MPALIDFSKKQICDLLVDRIKKEANEVAAIRRDVLSVMEFIVGHDPAELDDVAIAACDMLRKAVEASDRRCGQQTAKPKRYEMTADERRQEAELERRMLHGD